MHAALFISTVTNNSLFFFFHKFQPKYQTREYRVQWFWNSSGIFRDFPRIGNFASVEFDTRGNTFCSEILVWRNYSIRLDSFEYRAIDSIRISLKIVNTRNENFSRSTHAFKLRQTLTPKLLRERARQRANDNNLVWFHTFYFVPCRKCPWLSRVSASSTSRCDSHRRAREFTKDILLASVPQISARRSSALLSSATSSDSDVLFVYV